MLGVRNFSGSFGCVVRSHQCLDLNHDLTFSAHTINCVCHSIRSMSRALGICNFSKLHNCNHANLKARKSNLFLCCCCFQFGGKSIRIRKDKVDLSNNLVKLQSLVQEPQQKHLVLLQQRISTLGITSCLCPKSKAKNLHTCCFQLILGVPVYIVF